MESLRSRYHQVEQSLIRKSADVEKNIQRLVNDGWVAFDNLTEQYESSPFVKVTDKLSGCFNGLVMKHTDKCKKVLVVQTFGSVNLIRKVAIHVKN